MKRRSIVLFSGGLDSMLAVRILQRQGVAVEALNFKTMFTCCQDQAGPAAHRLGVKLTVAPVADDYLDLVRRPRWGYGKGANPCVDCRIYMFDLALDYMRQTGADFLASGEVLGQRPMSQKRKDLDVIAFHSGAEDLLLRPLCATRLPPTRPEREGWVNREALYDFCGRSRKPLIELARKFGIDDIPSPSTGCALTEKRFGQKVHDLVQLDCGAGRWDFELLRTGRHFRMSERVKVVVGRHEADNAALQYAHQQPAARSTALISPDGFPGPCVLVIGPLDDEARRFAVGMIQRYTDDARGEHVALIHRDGTTEQIQVRPSPAAATALTLAEQ